VDLLAVAGLGVALHAGSPGETDAALRTRRLDGLLLLLGMSRADLDDPPGAASLLATRSATPAARGVRFGR
jgi:hypothetical protein